MKSLEREWKIFRTDMLPPDVSGDQEDAVRIAWYGGVLGALIVLGQMGVPTTMLDRLAEECLEVGRSCCVRRGCGCSLRHVQ